LPKDLKRKARVKATLQDTNLSEVIRGLLAKKYDEKTADGTTIQYGGSVSSGNIAEFIGQPEIDGALVGGASLDASRFAQIVQAASVIAKNTRKS